MMDAGHHGLVFRDPLEPRILPQDGKLWFTRNADDRNPDGTLTGKLKQDFYRLHEFEHRMTEVDGMEDQYVSQCFFSARCRKHWHVSHATHGYVDCDYYKIPHLKGRPPHEVARELIWHCRDHQIAPPAIITSSGRGLTIKWPWTRPILGREDLGRAYNVNQILVQHLSCFGADRICVDLSRVFRIPHTINSKNGGRVEIIYLAPGTEAEPATFDFDDFCNNLLPLPKEAEPLPIVDRTPRGRILPADSQFTWRPWHWGVARDIARLAELRYHNGIVLPGYRDIFGHLMACQLARVFPARILMGEIEAAARSFLPADYIESELRGHTASLLQRAAQQANGQWVVSPTGRVVSPVYTRRKQTMFDILQVTAAEETHMRCLISEGEKKRRRIAAERAKGIVDRDLWLAQNRISADRPWEREGVSRATWYRRQPKP